MLSLRSTLLGNDLQSQMSAWEVQRDFLRDSFTEFWSLHGTSFTQFFCEENVSAQLQGGLVLCVIY